ncbi:MAG: hypothetical protein QNJ77_13760 [Acidimicrobiia bacterium]|nr:hypothetical protein [Acidimicrobiia bacterium]
MDITPDEVLAELRAIGDQLDALAPDAPERDALEQRRRDLRDAAQATADASRSREHLASELKHLKKRLAAFDAEKINVPAWQIAMTSGGRLTINDPAAHASKLNAALDEATALDREAIEARIEQLERALGE